MKSTKHNFTPCNIVQDNPQSTTRNRGFTIIEILITLLIFAISMIGIMSIRAVSLNGSFFTKNATVAAALGQTKIEELKNTAYSSITSGSAQEKGMNITWTVTPNSTTVTDSGMSTTYNFKDITVTVTWKQKKIELHTIISQG